ncbi:udp-glucose pyrophosphorylase [Vairimorpha apis BRL 01]|uniref:Udp-glucose pyrophosphorylase n=1 Tax=Vairimorpha apis BRL 01 TaxID=1037528 RepID=T0L857_9MICR|nr:udp-glucose pyrophosphorylase [Vairimorpha apis BRL 01]
MKDLEAIFSVLFTISPIIGFLPQIYTRNIIFPEILSLFTIMSNMLKLFHFSNRSLFCIIPIQGVFVIFLHSYLIFFNKSSYSLFEEKLMKKFKMSSKKIYCAYIGLMFIFIHLFGKIYKSYEFCGVLSLCFEVSVNIIQLILEKYNENLNINEQKKNTLQKQLYLVWVIGDLCRILFMLSIITPWIYIVASFIQLIIDVYLLFFIEKNNTISIV